jgi:hypothetical protein
MDDVSDDDTQTDDERPPLRQRLHAATGDRDAEAKALRDESAPEVTERDAKIAVQRARGEAGADQPTTEGEMATSVDAEEVHDELSEQTD